MKRALCRTLVLCAAVAIGSSLAAADMYTYIVVLHDRVAGGEPSEPDIPALGGEVLHRSENRRVVHVTAAAARSLAAHSAVRYMQRVQIAGQVPPLPQSSPVAATSVATNDWGPPTWTSGDFAYDGDGNITAIGADSFAYDSAGRLVSASIAHGSTQSEQYTYDSFGNLVATARTAGPSTSTPADKETNRLTDATYDSAGNVTASESGTTGYHYDSFNMLRTKSTSTGTSWYVYTADDERIGASENSVQRWMIRDLSGKVLREWMEAGPAWLWREDYVYRNGALAAAEREPAEGGTRHFHLDHLGTPRLITDQARLKIALHDYFPFGVEKTDFRQEMLDRGTHWPEDMKFTGHERDFSGGIMSDNRNQVDYMHARYYGPVWGRFLSVDPGRDWDPRQPQSWNLYSYVRNNPVRFTDPTGRYVCVSRTPGACNTIEAGLQKMRAAAAGLRNNDPKKKELLGVIAAFGKQGDDKTKISRVWINPSNPNGRGALLADNEFERAGKEGNLFISLHNIKAAANRDGADAFVRLGGTLTHGGRHMLQSPPGEPPSMLRLIFNEKQAFDLQKAYYQGLGLGASAPDPVKGAMESAQNACNQMTCVP